MKITRRIFALLILAVPAVLFSLAGSAKPPAAPHSLLVLVGTYTNKTQSKGIYAFSYDTETGKLTPKGVAAETPDPSWVAIHPNGKWAYAANESGKQSTISAFALDSQSGKLTLLNQLPALGEDPCYVSFDKTGKFVLIANYTSGNVVVFPILPDGTLGAATANVKDAGPLGPKKDRQEGPHAHWIESSIDGHSVYVADLGLDRVLCYAFDVTKGTLSGPVVRGESSHREFDRSAKLAPGTGPRHAVLSNDGAHMYVLGELQSTVTAFHAMGFDDFVPTSFQTISALPKGFSGRNDAAEIALHPSGKFLYSSNRGNDTIAVFDVQRRGGLLSLVADVPTGGKEPRHFAIDPAGKYLLAENENSDTIVTFRIDAASGKLTPTGDVAQVPAPVCLAFDLAH
jgi:6-phosphogluconolactonase